MGIDVTREHVFPLSEARRHTEYGPRRLRNFIQDGRESVSGKRVYLESCETPGGVMATSDEAFMRFNQAVNDEPLSTQDSGYRHRNGNGGNGASHD